MPCLLVPGILPSYQFWSTCLITMIFSPWTQETPPPTHVFTSDAGPLIHLLRIPRTSYLSERQLHVGVSVEVVASHGLSDLSDLGWGGRTDRLLLLCGWHLLLVCKDKKGGSEETTFS